MSVEVKLNGPIFAGNATEIVQGAVTKTIRSLIEKGHEHLAVMLSPRPQGVFLSVEEAGKGKVSRGNYRRNVHDEIQPTYGKLSDSGVIYGPWLEGESSRNQSTRFKGYASFRKTTQWLDGQADAVLRQHVAAMIAELS